MNKYVIKYPNAVSDISTRLKKVVITPTCELEWTVDLFDELVRAGIYMV